ncbi:MAG: pyridoxal-phosphate dependent enzyme, partial [Acidobacteria bacterium]|nr:pyridoxal-phosphate dependent enzyme [Acidobacteriota bacterium]
MRMDSPSSMVSAGENLSLDKVAAAWKTVRPALWPTPLLRCPALDELSGFRVWLKPENLQRTGSYKIRGAYYKLHQLKEQGGLHKVVAASAGNHAQGVAYAARELGMDCVIVMPERAALPKRRATQRYGAKVMLEGSCFDDSLAFALRYAPAEGREFISPFNDPDVILGQATLGWEILQEMQDDPPDAVLVPVGGGGLIAGVAGVVKQRFPQARMIALQSTCAPAFASSWKAYREGSAQSLPLDVPTQETIADG